MAFPKYESYKDSGEDWIGEVPKHWDVLRTKNVFRLVAEPAPKNNDEELLSVYSDIGVKPRRELEERGNKASTTDGYWIVKKGDVIVNKLLAWMGAIGVSDYDGVTSPAYDILRARKPIDSKFYHYLFRTQICIDKLKKHSKGIMEMRLRLYFDEFGNIKIPYPSIKEQNRIVDFLDRITSDIDQAIAKKQRLIELLNEQKAILINRAVTKGLNPNVPMRDSGIEWIGEIPEHWEVKRLVFITDLLQTGPFGSQLHQEDYIQEGIPVINPSQLTDGEIIPDSRITVSEATAIKLSRHRLIEGDIVFGRRGEMGRCGLVSTEQIGWICGTGSILFRPKTDLIEPRFALIAFRCDFMKANLEYISVGATMDNLNTTILAKVSIPVPSLEEQTQIVREVQKINEDISFIIDRELASIKLLFELKQTVISSTVTGKIKV